MRLQTIYFFFGRLLVAATIGAASFVSPKFAQAQTPGPVESAPVVGTQLKLVAKDEQPASTIVISQSSTSSTGRSPPPAPNVDRRPPLPPPSLGPANGPPANRDAAIGGPSGNSVAPSNDPTIPGAAIRELLGQGTPRDAGAPAAVPEVRLTSRIAVRNRPVVAVLDVGGRSVTVQEGDEFTVPIGGELVPLRVTVLSVTNVQIEIVNRRAVLHLK